MDLNRNKRLLENKTGGPLDTKDTFWDTTELVSWRTKTNKTEDYIHKCNRGPFCEEKKDKKNYNHNNCEKYRKCLPCYKAKLIFCSWSQWKQEWKMAAKE